MAANQTASDRIATDFGGILRSRTTEEIEAASSSLTHRQAHAEALPGLTLLLDQLLPIQVLDIVWGISGSPADSGMLTIGALLSVPRNHPAFSHGPDTSTPSERSVPSGRTGRSSFARGPRVSIHTRITARSRSPHSASVGGITSLAMPHSESPCSINRQARAGSCLVIAASSRVVVSCG